MDTFAAELILYYFPAVVFLIILSTILFRLKTISRQLKQSNDTSEKMVHSLDKIQQQLENRKT